MAEISSTSMHTVGVARPNQVNFNDNNNRQILKMHLHAAGRQTGGQSLWVVVYVNSSALLQKCWKLIHH